ncbi:MAG: DNA polymerase III subunit beta [Candidatus Sumerlaeota bacterium]|nr:DNA polymerase III subunit beta [Candidatus Sumerlaeota bacterium]
MKIKFESEIKDELLYATRVVSSLVLPQSSLPILGNIMISASGDEVTFVGSDMDSSVRCKIKASVKEEGETTVPAGPFSELVKELPKADVLFELTKDGLVHIEAGKNDYDLQTMPATDFPAWSDFEPLTSFELSQKNLRRMIEKTLFAIPTRDPRKVLIGAYLTVDLIIPDFLDSKGLEDPAHIRLVSTDGKKLGYIDMLAGRCKGESAIGTIIPQKVMAELAKVLTGEGLVDIHLGESKISFTLGDTQFITNKIDGDFPNYEMVIPKEFDHVVGLNKEAFIKAAKRAAIMTESLNNAISFHFKPGEMELEALTFDLGSYKGSIFKPDVEYEGEPFKLSFNYKYLLEALLVMETERITLHMKTPSQPIIFHEDGHSETLFLVMPIKMSQVE